MKGKRRSSFSGKLGFILSSAGAAVGLGNIWRFPYLAAKYGGGIFLLIYIILTVTFGFAMVVSETVIGRATEESPVLAFKCFSDSKLMHLGGWINAIIPILIVPYYSVIGGWVIKYFYEFITNDLSVIATDEFFGGFISDGLTVEIWFIVFSAAALAVIFMGVSGGIERVSKIMMPLLVVLAVIISIYVILQPGALAGVRYMFVPEFKNLSFMTVVSALGQMFYSLSIAMGILITFGSYMKKDVGIESSTSYLEIFDTGIAILAGLMIIPAVFAFSGGDPEALNAGPALMFITMPKVFAAMKMGRLIGSLFFLLVFLAALTSAISLTESAVATFEDQLDWKRSKSTAVMAVIMLALGTPSALGYGPLAMIKIAGMQFLDFFDYLTNTLMMPVAALFICFYITRSMGLDRAIEEVELNGQRFRRKKLYGFMIRYVCPVFILVILISSLL